MADPGMDQMRPPLPNEMERTERMVRHGVLWLVGGWLVLGVGAILYPAGEWLFAAVAGSWAAVIVTRFAFAKNEYARTHRSWN